jgi:NADH-quinone oxidoreductase subunit J
MAPDILYTGCVLGAIAVYILLRPGPRLVKMTGVALGLGALAWVVREAARAAGGGPEVLPAMFGLIAIAAAVRMITHPRPVYAALYFVVVVLSSAALFLLLEAEFMAFALIIVYAGAILITYLFVLMLAHQAPQPGAEFGQPEYDRVPREPAAAATVGFVMLALLSDVIINGTAGLPTPTAHSEEAVDNIERVGRALVADFPVSLELAGVILTMAMFGAVVLAQRQIELGEQEKRRAAGPAGGDA